MIVEFLFLESNLFRCFHKAISFGNQKAPKSIKIAFKDNEYFSTKETKKT